uniref:Uncharacterized protein n=1 Tax=Parascaris equorum TaxID=6256 RepID=A0A914S110_PAREQ
MLLTMEQAYSRRARYMPNPERLDRVAESMRNVEAVIHERNDAFFRLETGDGADPPLRTVTSFAGFTYKSVNLFSFGQLYTLLMLMFVNDIREYITCICSLYSLKMEWERISHCRTMAPRFVQINVCQMSSFGIPKRVLDVRLTRPFETENNFTLSLACLTSITLLDDQYDSSVLSRLTIHFCRKPATEHYLPAEVTGTKEYEVPYLDDDAYMMQKLWNEKEHGKRKDSLDDQKRRSLLTEDKVSGVLSL